MPRGLSIVVSNPLGPNLTRGKLLPLVELTEVREVMVVQNAPGPQIPKVRYVTLGPPRLGRLLHVFFRVMVLCFQIARTRPSVVMGFYMMPHGLIAYLLGRMTRRRVCLHVIGGPGEVIDGGYGLDQWRVRRPRLERLYLAVLRRADVVMVVGTETKRYLESHGVGGDRIHVMSSKIDSRRFRPVRDVRCDYDLILTAQLIMRKRVDLFLRIVAALKVRQPHIRAAILGDGPLREDLERLANSLGIGDHVDFLGFQEDTERYYNRAKVFVLTSSAEGLSLAMLEAMACGLPAVVPAVGDLGDVVQNGVTGYLVEGGDPDVFVTVLSKLLEHEELRRTLGDNARSTILDGYTVEDGARCWRAVLRNAIPRLDLGLWARSDHQRL
jgi:glycosyltransferase involved in cell wall biosynthesis